MKKNNKGFTLVELIIVIAIIAILAVVVAPQYLKYVESSRQATDANAVGEIAHAGEVASIGDGDTVIGDGTIKFTIDANGAATVESTDALTTAVLTIVDPTDYTFKSALYRGQTIEITVTDGVASWTAPTES